MLKSFSDQTTLPYFDADLDRFTAISSSEYLVDVLEKLGRFLLQLVVDSRMRLRARITVSTFSASHWYWSNWFRLRKCLYACSKVSMIPTFGFPATASLSGRSPTNTLLLLTAVQAFVGTGR